ncbi:hypothetical protein HGRIS_004886 [Hohenbuehelia grisea]
MRMPQVASSSSNSVQQNSSPMSHHVAASHKQAPPQSEATHPCMWADCSEVFTSMTALVGHVNLKHLRLPPPSSTELPSPAPSPASSTTDIPPPSPGFSAIPMQHHDPNNIFCLWRNCSAYPSAQSVPGPSSGDPLHSARSILANHLLHDHLGLCSIYPEYFLTPSSSSQPSPLLVQQSFDNFGTPAQVDPSTHDWTADISRDIPPEFAAPLSPPVSHSGSSPDPRDEIGNAVHDCALEVHKCLWESCGEMFASCNDLTEHLNSVHVGSGRGQYECRWEGCDRSGERSFASKQKICRHLQTHTGHRPFQCKVCNQHFSEAATLQQHMRRHTHEKPYKCTHPGCGKSFSIRGALTIHERTHNGDKPFKCTFCEKAFAESSNLSKHLRTHTGARPYSCKHEGCGKAFARPDQLTRHMAIHKKK